MSVGDDVGMNLLVSAAAGEMSRSDLISLTDSPQRNTHMVEDSWMGEDARSKSSHGNNLPQEQNRSADVAVACVEKRGVTTVSSSSKDGLHYLRHRALATSLEREKPVPPYPTIYQQERKMNFILAIWICNRLQKRA